MPFRLTVLLLLAGTSLGYAGTYPYILAPKTADFYKQEEDFSGYEIYIRTSKKRVTVSTGRSFPESDHKFASYNNFSGKPIKTGTVKNGSKEDVPEVDGKFVYPSTYTAKFRARSPEGKTITGFLVTHVGPSPSTTINGVEYGRYRIHYRLDATISDPSVLGFKHKTFTLKKTVRSWLSHPDGP